jgi:hypothetical protein
MLDGADESIAPPVVKETGSQVFCVVGLQITGQADWLDWQY